MERVRYPAGAEISFETFFDELQDKAFSNLQNRVQTVIDSYGLALTVKNGNYENQEFRTTLTNLNGTVSVDSGSALTPNGQYINISSPLTTDNLATQNTNNGYAVVLTYKETGYDSAKAFNSFVFDKLGGNRSLNRKTKFSDSVGISLEQITSNLLDLRSSLENNQIAIAVVYNSTGTFSPSSAGLSSYPEDTSGDYRIIDLRKDERMLLSSSLIDDQKILFKDRPSIGSNKFNQAIQFGQKVSIDGKLEWTDGSGSAYYYETDANSLNLTSSTGQHLSFYQDGTASKTRVSFLEADDIKVNRGTVGSPDWKDVITKALGNATDPQNLRIYDINPTNDSHEKYSLVTFRWNFDDINGNGTAGTSQFTLSETSFNNEPIDLNTYNPVGKILYFPASDNSYEITAVSYTSPDYTLTLDGTLTSADTSTSSQPAKIIDSNVASYRITIKNVNTGQVYTQELNESFIKKPQYAIKLELGETWSMSLQSLDIGYSGSTISMSGGTYDPDHISGGQSDVNYNAEFVNKLPSLSGNGSLDLSADTQGFIAKVSGWSNSSNKNKDSHEYEMIYSSETDLTATSFDNIDSAGIERKILTAGKAHISSGQPTKYSVAVRPLQNKQPVASPIIKEVVSGGGGVAPNDSVLISKDVEIKVVTAEVQSVVNTDEAKVIWKDKGGAQIYTRPDFAEGRWMRRTSDNSEYQVQWHRDYAADAVGVHRIRIPNIGNLTTSEVVKSGDTKKDRKIDERDLEIDYRITKIEFLANSTTDTSSADPAIIRVYQKGLENSAVMLEVPNMQENPWTQSTDMPVKLASDGTRSIVVDAWDPDPENTGSPNNDCELSGKVTVTGRPIVVNNLN